MLSAKNLNEWWWAFGLILVGSVYKMTYLFQNGLRVYQDSLIFQHAGWFMTVGGRLYVDFFEVKPPAVHEISAIVAILSGGDPLTQHLVSILLMNLVVVGTLPVLGLIVYELTEDATASFIGGLAMLCLPRFALLGAGGIFAKSFALLMGLLGLYFALRNRWLLAGVTAAAAPAFWQFGLIFPLLTVGMSYLNQSDDMKSTLGVTCLGGAVSTTVILAPIVVWGGFGEMLMSVLVAPATSSGDTGVIYAINQAISDLKVGGLVVLLGGFGIVRAVYTDRTQWWLLAGASWFLIQLMVFDYDGGRDLYLGMAFAAIGFGLLYHEAPRPALTGPTLKTLLALTILLNATVFGVFGITSGHSLAESKNIASTDQSEQETLHSIYWEQHRPTNCYYNAPYSGDLQEWLRLTGEPLVRQNCPSVF